MPNTDMTMISKTIRLPKFLVDQISEQATVCGRSFTRQCEQILTQAIDGSVEADLKLIAEMRKRSQTSQV